MGRFEGFYTGGEAAVDNGGFSRGDIFKKEKQKRDKEDARRAQLELWINEIKKCSSISDYQNYIKRFDNPDNPYILKAKNRVKELSHIATDNSQGNNNKLVSQSSSNDSSGLFKVIIGVVVILLGVALLCLKFVTDKVPTSALCGFWLLVVAPVYKWAFGD